MVLVRNKPAHFEKQKTWWVWVGKGAIKAAGILCFGFFFLSLLVVD
jgi:hypothetical protein